MLRERVSLVSSDIRSSDVIKLIEEDIDRTPSIEPADAELWKLRLSRKSNQSNSVNDIRESLLGGAAASNSCTEEERAEFTNIYSKGNMG
jgi:hypothetical protein